MSIDFNNVPEQQSFEVIPDGTNAVVQLHIREGGVGEDGLLKLSENRQAEMLSCEFTVVEGNHAKRKFFANMVLSGATDGHAQAADISKRQLRAILESARGIKPKDVSEAAIKARHVEGYRDFEGIRFWARIGVEPAKDRYRAKNILLAVITPDMKGWRAIQQVEQPLMHAGPTDAKAIVKPAWAP
jgi:hypothetical protein